MRARWRSTLDASKAEALLAVDIYNQSVRERRLEGYFVHMHIAWLYLFEAEYERDGKGFHYRDNRGHFVRVDGEPKAWELGKFMETELSDTDPVRKNLELTTILRNKIEHRYEQATTIATTGYAQSLLMNYEERLTNVFGVDQSLGSILRFPIFVGTLTKEGAMRLEDAQKSLPRQTRQFLDKFESGLSPSIVQDQKYEFRVRLIPKLGSKTDADLALTFVREEDLTAEERDALLQAGQAGTVIVREQIRTVANEDKMKPTPAAAAVEARIPFKFRVHHVTQVWKRMNLHPPNDDSHPERTRQEFCVYDRPHKDYVYTQAFVDYVSKKCETDDGFRDLTGMEPVRKD